MVQAAWTESRGDGAETKTPDVGASAAPNHTELKLRSTYEVHRARPENAQAEDFVAILCRKLYRTWQFFDQVGDKDRDKGSKPEFLGQALYNPRLAAYFGCGIDFLFT